MDINNSVELAQAGSATGSMCALTIGSHTAEGSANGAAPLIPFGAPKLPFCMRGAPSGRALLLGSYCGAAGSFPHSYRQLRLLPVPMPRDQLEASAWGERIVSYFGASARG